MSGEIIIRGIYHSYIVYMYSESELQQRIANQQNHNQIALLLGKLI